MIRCRYTKPWDVEATEEWIADSFHRGLRLTRVIGMLYFFKRDDNASNKRCYMSVYVQGHGSEPNSWKLKTFYYAKGFSSYIFEIIKNSKKNIAFCKTLQKSRRELIRMRMGYRLFASAFISIFALLDLILPKANLPFMVLIPAVGLSVLYVCYCLYSIIRITIQLHKAEE